MYSTCPHRIIDDSIEKSIQGRRIGLAHLLDLLYRPISTHSPHIYPTPGWVWGMGVVGECARAVLAWPPSPLTPLLHNLAVVPAWQHPQTKPPLCPSLVC